MHRLSPGLGKSPRGFDLGHLTLRTPVTPPPSQIRCMLNIWGVILYLRLPWITAQAGIGECRLLEEGKQGSWGCRGGRLGHLLPSTLSDGSSHRGGWVWRDRWLSSHQFQGSLVSHSTPLSQRLS